MATWPAKINYATGDVLTAAQMNDIGGELNDLYNGRTNPVLNSNFSVWQRGTSFSNSSNAQNYTADRWNARTTAAGMANTVSRQSTSDTTNLPNIQYCARVQRNSGQTGTSFLIFEQGFETVNSIPFAGKTVTLSFYARAGANFSASGNTLISSVVNGTGTDQMPGVYTGGNYPTANNTLTTTWQRFSTQFTVPATATEIAIQFYYTATGTASTNDYFEVTGVQLDIGSVALPYKPNASTQQGELAACQRYYYRTTANVAYGYLSQLGVGISTTQANIPVKVPTTMRVVPTSIDYPTVSTLRLTEGVNAYTLGGTPAISGDSTTDNVVVSGFTVTGITQFRPYFLTANNSTSAYLGFNSEL